MYPLLILLNGFMLFGQNMEIQPFIFDQLSIVYLCYLLILGLLIYLFSKRHLSMSYYQKSFNYLLGATLITTLGLSISQALLVLSICWILSGWCLFQLLKITDTEDARLQANRFKKYDLISCGSLLLAAFVQNQYPVLSIVLLLNACVVRMALSPYHNWLSNSLAAPSPVSALMHAGLVNGGLLIILRYSEIIWQQHIIMMMVLVVSVSTLILMYIKMKDEMRVKQLLAMSTSKQMSIMMIHAALGSFSSALVHLMLHGFTKASMFMGAGDNLKHANVNNQKYADVKSALLIYYILVFATAGFLYLFNLTLPLHYLIIILLAATLWYQSLSSSLLLADGYRLISIILIDIAGLVFYLSILFGVNYLLDSTVFNLHQQTPWWVLPASLIIPTQSILMNKRTLSLKPQVSANGYN